MTENNRNVARTRNVGASHARASHAAQTPPQRTNNALNNSNASNQAQLSTQLPTLDIENMPRQQTNPIITFRMLQKFMMRNQISLRFTTLR